jgi:glycosyltransferase involved in cell wall biosynthesis
VFVFNELRVDGGRLTQLWLARLRAFAGAGWATHAAMINKDPDLARSVATLVGDGQMPADTVVHHYAQRDRRIRPAWYGPYPPGTTMDDRVGDWLDWLTARVPGAVVMADSPAAYPYVARMTNPLVARIAGIHLNHLAADDPGAGDPAQGRLTSRFAERFATCQEQFDALVVMTAGQAADLRRRFGEDTPVVTIPPGVPAGPAPPGDGATSDGPRRIVSVGPLEPSARHEDALHTLRAVAAEHPDVRLDIVGEGERSPELATLAEELGVADRVTIRTPGPDADDPFRGAALSVWTGSRDACPLAIIRSLGQGVGVVARDVRYGPAELLTDPILGEPVDSVEALAAAVRRRLAQPNDAAEVRIAAGPLLRRTDPAAVGQRWAALAASLADDVYDRRTPRLLVEEMSTATRVLRLAGVLAESNNDLAAWSCELPGLIDPAGWLAEPAPTGEADGIRAPGPTREVLVQLRSDALAFVAVETGQPYRVEFTDGTSTAPLLATGFSDRIIASRVGTATLSRRADGSAWVAPTAELMMATNLEGRLLVRTGPDEPASDVTHAIDWIVDLDWADMTPVPEGTAFRGVLRAVGIAPADDSPPAICVTDVGGFSRVVGVLRYEAEPSVRGTEWTAPVAGVLETEALAATTHLARRALALHVGYRGVLVPVGGLWTHGERAPIRLSSPRGEVTLLPSPGGRVLAAPGRGYRARVSGAMRAVVGRA